MTQDYGILITAPGTDVRGAPTSKVIMNTSNPFIKIDTQNPKGFQTITLLITNNPPEPGAGGYTRTVLYQYAHGYKYVPSIESLFQITSPGAATANGQPIFQDNGTISAHTFDDYADLYAVADATNVYLICEKFIGTISGLPNDLTGTNMQITVHVFVEDIGV